MNIFKNRPLCLACMTFIIFTVIGYFVPSAYKIAFIAIAVFILTVNAIFYFWKKSSSYRSLCVFLVTLSVILSSFSSYVYFNIRQDSFEEYYEENHVIEAVVTSIKSEDVNFGTYEIEVRRIDDDTKRHKAIISIAFDSALDVGDLFTIEAKAHDSSEYYSKEYLLSEGIFIIYNSTDPSSLNFLKSGVLGPKAFFNNINKYLSDIITDNLDEESGALSSALLLGNKDLLPDIVKRDFKRAGASHFLALSGMHVSILMGALMFILKRLRLGAKKIAIILSACALMYLFVTGMSLSTSRAVIMMLFVYMGILFKSRHDSLTSLSFAGMLILFITPGAVLDAGFWMSLSATLGLLVYMPAFIDFMNKRLEKYKRYQTIIKPVKFIANLIATSVFAIIPLITVACIFTREFSLNTVLSSVVLSIPTAAMIILTFLLLIFSGVAFLHSTLAFAISGVSGFMIDFCSRISDTEHAIISLQYPFIIIFATVILFTIIYSCVSGCRNIFIALTPYAIAVVLLISSVSLFNYLNKDVVKVSYINASSRADMLVVTNDREAVVIDVGTGSKSSYTQALEQTKLSRATEIQALIITKCTSSHSATLIDFFSNNMVRELWLPYPKNEDEYYNIVPLLSISDEFGVKTMVYQDGEDLQTFDNVNISTRTDMIERSAVPIFVISINCREERLLYTSPAYNEGARAEEVDSLIEKSEYVIFGNRGPLTKTPYRLPENKDTEIVVFSDVIRAAFFDNKEEQSLTYALANEPIAFYIEK